MLELTRDQRVVLDPCSWETYQRIVREHKDRSAPRFTYDRGVLEIMSPSSEHEITSEAIKQLVWEVCAERSIPVLSLGSTTQRREALQRGVEPDSSYLFGDLRRDPEREPPDLVVEVELTRSALDKLPIFAQLGVPEVWRWSENSLSIWRLAAGTYQPAPHSGFLPVTATRLTEILRQFEPASWPGRLRSWARAL